ncbi:MAG: Ig-like domain-containing protein [Candidatus Latescibacterota bacterium]|jgi:hypothetical protein
MKQRIASVLFLVFVVFNLPTPLLAARLELRQVGTGTTDTSVLVGDEIEVELWIDSENQPLSGAAVFLSFDSDYLQLVDEDRTEQGGFQPFAPGGFLANGEIFRNYLLDEDDPAASATGIQLDYSIVRASDQGEGPIATFRLRALAPAPEMLVRIDESGARETRFFLPDGDQRSFRFIKPLRLTVQGITISGLPERLVLPRGGRHEFALNDYIFDPIYGKDEIIWNLSPIGSLASEHDQESNSLFLRAPDDTSVWEQLILTATNPAGQTTSDTLEIFVNTAPIFSTIDALILSEDSNYSLALDALVDDQDTSFDLLEWTFTVPPELTITLDAKSRAAQITPQANWYGETSATLIARDNFDFADTMQVQISIAPINDPPYLLQAPNVRLTRGRSDNSLRLDDLFADIEDAGDALKLSWIGNEQVILAIEGGRLVVTAAPEWTGSEEITLVVEDSQGLTATGPLGVTIVPSLAPALVGNPGHISLASGASYVLNLDELVVDPDDADETLVWQVEGYQELHVQLSSSRLARIEAPSGFTGFETLLFSVTDPTGEKTSFALDAYALPASGEPLFANLPELHIPIDGIDTSIDLDLYIYDLDHDPSVMDFFLSQREDVALRVDAQSHVLVVEPQASAVPSIIEIEVRAIDPDGHEAVQILRLHLLDAEGESGPFFSLTTLPAITLEPGQMYTLLLDAFVVGDIAPSDIVWRVEDQESIQVVIDPLSREVAIRALQDWSGDEIISFVAQTGDLPEQRQSVRISALAPQTSMGDTPQLAALPNLSLAAGAFDQSLDLDDFVANAQANDFIWNISGGVNARVLVDSETNRLFVFSGEGWQGEEIFTLVGTHDDGTRLETTLRVAVVLPQATISLKGQTEIGLFAGTSEIRLGIAELMTGDADPAQIQWTAQGLQPVNARYDTASAELILTRSSPWQGSDIIEIKAIIAGGIEVSGLVLAQVFPSDGSMGNENEDFSLALVPNAFQSDYIDVFIVDDMEAMQSPLLRLNDGAWSDLNLVESGSGIWHASHVLYPGQEGAISFLALSIDAGQQLFKSSYTFNVGTVRSGSGKVVADNAFAIDLPAGSFASDAVVALLPSAITDTGPELIALSAAYRTHSPQNYINKGGLLRATLPTAVNKHAGLYRYADGQWQWMESSKMGNKLVAELQQFGLFALMEDRTPPHIRSATDATFTFADAGSGLADVEVQLAGAALPPSSYGWDGERLTLEPAHLPAGENELVVHITDRAGNSTSLRKNIGGTGTPLAFALRQNYPNPFNPSTAIPFDVPALATIHLEIYNSAGQRVRRLAEGLYAPGQHELSWDTRDDAGQPVASGLYIYRLLINGQLQTRKMTLMR